MSTVKDLPANHGARTERAALALEGLSIGDAFGERFFGPPEMVIDRIVHREAPAPPWGYTDDTAMALCVHRCLVERGEIDRDYLATLFAAEYQRDSLRGYGGTVQSILRAIGEGTHWAEAAAGVFAGMGSMGNGGGMRIAPLGAYFADDTALLLEQARASAEITHAHPEGQAGAIAVALAAAWAWNHRDSTDAAPAAGMLEYVIAHTPDSDTWARIRRTTTFPWTYTPQLVGQKVGNGSLVTAPDTVPLAIWCAARHWRNYPDALWNTVRAFGDMDTTCAMVGGIVALSAGRDSIPNDWRFSREPLPH